MIQKWQFFFKGKSKSQIHQNLYLEDLASMEGLQRLAAAAAAFQSRA